MHSFGLCFGGGYLPIQLLTMIGIVSQGGVHLSESQLRVVQRQLFRAPPVGHVLTNQMNDLGVLAPDQGPVRIGTIQMLVSVPRD